MPTALTIAGSDSSGGAGLQADLKTFAAFGVYGASAVTAVTAQSTSGVGDITALSGDAVTAQIEIVAGDMPIDAVKTGMLATAAIVEAVAAAISELDLPLVVVDPVLASSSGTRLLETDAIQAMIAELLPHAFVITPNLIEAEALSGCRITSRDTSHEAARRLFDLGPSAVIITGGHREGDEVVDLLFDGELFIDFKTARVEGGDARGTGCTYASALAAGLALGRPLVAAAEAAQQYVAGALRHARAVGRGSRVLDHFWQAPSGRPLY